MRVLPLLVAAVLLLPPFAGAVGPFLPLLPVGLPPDLDPAWGVVKLREFHPFVDADARFDAVATDGEGLFLAGWVETPAGDTDLVLQHLDRSLKSLWRFVWGGLTDERPHGIAFEDGALYVTGFVAGDAPGDLDLVAQRWSLGGELAWSLRWGGQGAEEGVAVAALGDAVYVAGSTTSGPAGEMTGDADAVLLRLDAATGAVVWVQRRGDAREQRFGGVLVDTREPVVQAVGRWDTGDPARLIEGYYLEVDADDGAPLRERFEGSPHDDALSAVQPMEDGLLLAGARGLAGGGREAWALRVDPDQATPVWERILPGDGDEAITAAAAGTVRVALTGEDGADMLIAALEADGAVAWQTLWDHGFEDAGFGLATMGSDVFPVGATHHAGLEAGTLLHVRECSLHGLAGTQVDPEVALPYLTICVRQLTGL